MKSNKIQSKILILIILLATSSFGDSESWGWKRSSDPDDVMNFLNGEGSYSDPVKDARISVVWKGSYYDFIVYYCRDRNSGAQPGWAWKKATTIDDAYNFINTLENYTTKIKEYKICGVWKDSYPEFYIFYRRGQVAESWGWKLATTLEDAKKFLSREGSYSNPVKNARIASINKESHVEYYIFYQHRLEEGVTDNWGWKKSYNPDDVMQFINGSGNYSDPLKEFEVCAIEKESSTEYIVFYKNWGKLDSNGIDYEKIRKLKKKTAEEPRNKLEIDLKFEGLEKNILWVNKQPSPGPAVEQSMDLILLVKWPYKCIWHGSCPTSQIYDFFIEREDKIIWKWSEGKVFNMVVTPVQISGADFIEFPITWHFSPDEIEYEGTYTVRAIFIASGQEICKDFEIKFAH